ncbi:MAG: hypothetical protein AB7E98_12000 [Pirellulales bacterium]
MIQVTTSDLLMYVLAALAGCGAMAIIIHRMKERAAFRRLCMEAHAKAVEWGFTLFAELLEAVATLSIGEIVKEVKNLLKLFKDQPRLIAHLKGLLLLNVARFLNENSPDTTVRDQIVKLVDDFKSKEAAVKAAIAATVKTEAAPAPKAAA